MIHNHVSKLDPCQECQDAISPTKINANLEIKTNPTLTATELSTSRQRYPSRCGQVLLSTQKSIAYESLINHILSVAPSIQQPCLCVPRRHCPLAPRSGFKMRTGKYHNSMARRSRTLLSRPGMRSNGSMSIWQTFLARIKCII